MRIGFYYQSSIYALIQKGWTPTQLMNFCCPREQDKFYFITQVKNEDKGLNETYGMNCVFVGRDEWYEKKMDFLDVLILCGERKDFSRIKKNNPNLFIYFMTRNNMTGPWMQGEDLEGILCTADHHVDEISKIRDSSVLRCYRHIHPRSYMEISFEREVRDSVLRCMMVAKPHAGKNHMMLFDAVDIARRKVEVELDLYGVSFENGHNITNAVLSGILDRVEGTNYINIMPRFSHDRMAEEFRRHDCSILPTESEGLCFSALDSVMSGTPILCPKIRPFTDYCIEGENALFFDLNPQSIADCMVDFAARKNELISSAEARKKEYYTFTVEYAREEWKKFWNELDRRVS